MARRWPGDRTMDHRRIEGSSCRQWAVKGSSLCLRPFYPTSSREGVFSETQRHEKRTGISYPQLLVLIFFGRDGNARELFPWVVGLTISIFRLRNGATEDFDVLPVVGIILRQGRRG